MTLDLFSQPYAGTPPYQKGSDTSRAAALSVLKSASTKRAKLFHFLARRGDEGATDEELEHGLQMLRSSVCGRRNELVQLELVKDSGIRRVGRTGRPGAVWIINPQHTELR